MFRMKKMIKSCVMSLIPIEIDTNVSFGKSKLLTILWSEYCTKYSFFNVHPPLGVLPF